MRSQLQEEAQALKNLGQILLDVGEEAKDTVSDLMQHRFERIADIIIDTGKAINTLSQWSVTEKIFDISEAIEVLDIVNEIKTMSEGCIGKGSFCRSL